MTPAAIDTVVFDLGKVLIDFEYGDLLTFLVDHGVRIDSKTYLLEHMDLYAYERGEIDDAQFMANVCALADRPVDRDALRNHWNRIFTPIPAMLDLADHLAATHRVYVLSNASSMHWTHLIETYHIDRIGHGQLASWQAGVRKPDAAIYRRAETQFGFAPHNAVFIDDMVENAEGARHCGWHAIHHRDPPATRRALADLGVS